MVAILSEGDEVMDFIIHSFNARYTNPMECEISFKFSRYAAISCTIFVRI